jgi:hypothetical protein
MPRAIRFIPDGGALVEVTDRTVQSRFLTSPPIAKSGFDRRMVGCRVERMA